MEYSFFTKKNELVTSVATWMMLEIIMLSEINWAQTNTV
jgi:hypothetical protein